MFLFSKYFERERIQLFTNSMQAMGIQVIDYLLKIGHGEQLMLEQCVQRDRKKKTE